MRNPRGAPQAAHERVNVNLLIDALNSRHRSDFKVISEPHQTEAIIQSRRNTRWVEVAEDERHQPIGGEGFSDTPPEFAKNFVDSVQRKLEESSYESFRDAYGPGYLLVSTQLPFLGKEAFELIDKEWRGRTIRDQGCFRSLYIAYRVLNGYKLARWQPPAQGSPSSESNRESLEL